MKPYRTLLLLLLVLAAAVSSCVYDFNPDLSGEEGYLVVDGDIVLGDVSSFTIQRSSRLDSWDAAPVSVNRLTVEASDGTTYEGSGRNGYMQIDLRTADPSLQYRLVLEARMSSAADPGESPIRRYVSSWSALIEPAALDSLSYSINEDRTELAIQVSTHSAEQTGYYRWAAEETWEYTSDRFAAYYFLPAGSLYRGQPVAQDTVAAYEDGENLFYCWTSQTKSQLMTGTTETLAEDRLVNHQMFTLSYSDWRVSYVYAVDIRQTRISEEAYRYWETLMRNTTDVGGLFSPEPTELRGNVVNEADEQELVLGYVSVVKAVTGRLFFDNRVHKFYKDMSRSAVEPIVPEKRSEWIEYYQAGYVPTTFKDPDDSGGDIPTVVYGVNDEYYWMPVRCVDCRYKGGTKNKPAWWPTPET